MQTRNLGKKLRGVNLGGWLVLEKWMTPSLFDELQAEDETSFCVELGENAAPRLRAHWQSFITRDDFAWLCERGINAVRIPVGHWLFGADYPYHRSYGDNRYPFVLGGLDILDLAFDWAEEMGLRIVLDLHAAPGCQNGFDNGGIKDVCEWHTDAAYIEHALKVLERLAQRYRHRPALHGIEVLNEPRWDIETTLLKDYTQAAYQRIRRHCPPEQVAVVFHGGFRSFREYQGFLTPPTAQNVVLDMHRYQCFVQDDVNMDIFEHIRKTVTDWHTEAETAIAELDFGIYIGEWSLGLDLQFIERWAQNQLGYTPSEMDVFQLNTAYRAYAAAQLLSFETYLGWFFWSYKTETMRCWSFRDCVEQGWLPGYFGLNGLPT